MTYGMELVCFVKTRNFSDIINDIGPIGQCILMVHDRTKLYINVYWSINNGISLYIQFTPLYL
jgi:hypothetical protein